MDFQQKEKYNIEDLLSIMKLLRKECPWDKEQTHVSIRKNFIEEVYEVAEAIDLDDKGLLLEELGDVLLQIVFHTEMEQELGNFDFDDVCNRICTKLILRHPHIFADVTAKTTDEVLSNWDNIKRREKNQQTHAEVLQSVPVTLPALMRSEKVQSRAAKIGFDFPTLDDALQSLYSEVDELTEAVESKDPEHVFEELGDLLFSAVNVARFTHIDSENALTKACEKFMHRFSRVEQLANQRGIQMENTDMETLDCLWKEVKIND